jgi:hypothetical protein
MTTTSSFQSFSTRPVLNTRLALYALSIRSPGGAAYQTYTFPISPASLVKEYSALTNSFDVAGTPQQNGVQRTIDTYGITPVSYHLDGTTGWQQHSTDGFVATGIESILQLEQMLALYAQLNATAVAGNQPLYTLEFFDYFLNDFWQIEPMGRQEFRQSRERPLVVNYSLHWQGVRDLSAPAGPSSTTTLFDSSSSSVGTTAAATSFLETGYADNTPGAQALQTTYGVPSSQAVSAGAFTGAATG